MNTKSISIDQVYHFEHGNKSLVKNIHPLKHAFRINGVVDVYKRGFCVYNVVENIYHRFEKIADVFSMVKQILKTHPEQPTFNQKKDGKLTYRAFKQRMENSDWRPEKNHWYVNKEKKSEDYLYFATDGMGRIKIGRSNNPWQRIKSINTGNASNVELVMVVKNKGCLEKNFHNCFKAIKVKGEWFSFTDRVNDFLNYLRKNNYGYEIKYYTS